MDSGADISFLDTGLAQSLGISLIPLSDRHKTVSLDSSLLWEITHKTEPVKKVCSKNHTEEIIFFAYSSSNRSWSPLAPTS